MRYTTPQPGLTHFRVVGRTIHGGMNYEGGLAGGSPIVKDVLGFR